MALGSQASQIDAISALTGLTHDIFVGDVVNNVRRESPVSMMFQDAQPGEYEFSGQNMTFATDLQYITGAMATDGKIPDYRGMDAVQGQVTPVRRYKPRGSSPLEFDCGQHPVRRPRGGRSDSSAALEKVAECA